MHETECRICWEDGETDELLKPCKCNGTIAYVHASCWEKANFSCNICNYTRLTTRTNNVLFDHEALVMQFRIVSVKLKRKRWIFGLGGCDLPFIFSLCCLQNFLLFWALPVILPSCFLARRFKLLPLLTTILFSLTDIATRRILVAQTLVWFLSLRAMMCLILYNDTYLPLVANIYSELNR